ncbi:MAG: hypothetical protein AB8I08_13185 [Sandaracinaceae bacterium]
MTLRRPWSSLLVFAVFGLLLDQGCVQLVAFEQPIVGVADDVDGPDRGDLACDEEVRIGGGAICDVACTIEEGQTETACGDAVRLEDGELRLDLDGTLEAEITFTACGPLTAPARITSASGAGVRFEGRAASVVRADGEATETHPHYVPDAECGDRTLVFQDGRLELVERGQRWCGEHLPRFSDGPWQLAMLGGGISSVELCLRAADEDESAAPDGDS